MRLSPLININNIKYVQQLHIAVFRLPAVIELKQKRLPTWIVGG